MKLEKRYLRNFKENLSFYLSSTLLTLLALMLFFLYNISGDAILTFKNSFFTENRVEDAHFSTYLPIPEEKLREWEEKYGVVTETEKYLHLENEGITSRVFRKNRKIDLYRVTEGRDVEKDSETVISEGYALNRKIKIGDRIRMGEKSYTVVGYIQRPDYLYMLENVNDAYKNIDTFRLAYLTDSAFDALGEPQTEILVQYGENTDITAFRKEVNRDFHVTSYVNGKENPRLQMVNQQADLFVSMSYVLLFTVPLIAVALISIMMSRKVKGEMRICGTLSALGYRKSRLMFHYAGFAALPGLFGGVLSLLISLLAAQPFAEAGLMDYEPMRLVGKLNPVSGVLGVLVPTLLYVLSAMCTVGRLLKKDTVTLLLGANHRENGKTRRFLVGKPGSVKTKFAWRSLLENPARSFVTVLGIFLGSFVMLTSFGILDSVNATKGNVRKDLGSYDYQYMLSGFETETPKEGEPLLVLPLEGENQTSLSLYGVEGETSLLNLSDTEGKPVDLSRGFYVSTLAAYAFDWHPGDRVTVRNMLSLEEFSFEIRGIVENRMQKAVYAPRKDAAKIGDLPEGVFNSLLSETELSLPGNRVAFTVKASEMEAQTETISDLMGPIVWVLVVLGALVAVNAVYVTVNMTVTENRGNISMLKVLGYRKREIHRAVLSGNHILVPIGIILSIFPAYLICKALFRLYVDYGLMLMTYHITLSGVLISLGLTVGSYILSLVFLQRKIRKVDMIESLKDNRE